MPSAHAKLSPSASERWISCPASIRLGLQLKAEGVEEEESVYALEGTAAHALGELKARHQILEQLTLSEFNEALAAWQEEFADILALESVDPGEMEEHTQAYVELIRERLALFPNSVLMLEQRMDTGVPTCWGTSDAVIVSPTHVEIIDFKYGAGVFVLASDNSQLRLYAVGALDSFADLLGDTELVRITVHQPRMDNVGTEEISPIELRAWRDSIIPIAESALGDDAVFGPSDEACRWCPASGRCPAQLAEVFSTDFEVEPETLSPEEVGETLPKLRMISDWMKAFEAAALNLAYSEEVEIPGYKVVMSGGTRSVVDPDGAIEVLTAAGYAKEDLGKTGEFKVHGIGVLEKLLKKPKFKELLEDPGYVKKGEGRPSLVPESDRRPDINPNSEASKDFAQEEEA